MNFGYVCKRLNYTILSANRLTVMQAGYIESCTVFEDIPLGWGCADIFDYYSLTVEQFYEYNPAVGSDCSNLWTSKSVWRYYSPSFTY
jgi:hypothetical protein